MYLLFALFFSLFNVISDPPLADCLDTKKYLLFVLTQKVSKKVKTGSFC